MDLFLRINHRRIVALARWASLVVALLATARTHTNPHYPAPQDPRSAWREWSLRPEPDTLVATLPANWSTTPTFCKLVDHSHVLTFHLNI